MKFLKITQGFKVNMEDIALVDFRVKPEYFKNFQPSLFDDLPKIKGKK